MVMFTNVVCFDRLQKQFHRAQSNYKKNVIVRHRHGQTWDNLIHRLCPLPIGKGVSLRCYLVR